GCDRQHDERKGVKPVPEAELVPAAAEEEEAGHQHEQRYEGGAPQHRVTPVRLRREEQARASDEHGEAHAVGSQHERWVAPGRREMPEEIVEIGAEMPKRKHAERSLGFEKSGLLREAQSALEWRAEPHDVVPAIEEQGREEADRRA